MKFAWKIFFVSFTVTILLFGIGGFILLNSVFTTSLNNMVKTVCDNNSYVTSSFYAVLNNAKTISHDKNYINYIVNNFEKQLSNDNMSTKVNIGNTSDMSFYNKDSFINKLEQNNRGWQIVSGGEKIYLQAVSRMTFDNKDFYIETLTDITDVYTSRDNYYHIYQIVLMLVAFLASFILVVFSTYITYPLVKLSNISRKIAKGDFSIRVNIRKKSFKTDEIYQLSKNFNTMADFVEKYIDLLKQEAQRRDDFIADFTHELKTPLTSVIGYADMLRSFELDAEQRRKCADYIYKEGKRLEALSANLLKIIVLKNNEIQLIPVKTDVIFNEIENTVRFLIKKYNIALNISAKSAVIMIEPSLFKTMLYNIIDNACKASEEGQTIEFRGCLCDKGYKISVQDFGRGIPKKDIEKITMPFYMVDKSRSRNQGGAGLGLALCKEIAKLHGSDIDFYSELGKGTTVSVCVKIKQTGE